MVVHTQGDWQLLLLWTPAPCSFRLRYPYSFHQRIRLMCPQDKRAQYPFTICKISSPSGTAIPGSMVFSKRPFPSRTVRQTSRRPCGSSPQWLDTVKDTTWLAVACKKCTPESIWSKCGIQFRVVNFIPLLTDNVH